MPFCYKRAWTATRDEVRLLIPRSATIGLTIAQEHGVCSCEGHEGLLSHLQQVRQKLYVVCVWKRRIVCAIWMQKIE